MLRHLKYNKILNRSSTSATLLIAKDLGMTFFGCREARFSSSLIVRQLRQAESKAVAGEMMPVSEGQEQVRRLKSFEMRLKPQTDYKKACKSVEEEQSHEKCPRWLWARIQMGNLKEILRDHGLEWVLPSRNDGPIGRGKNLCDSWIYFLALAAFVLRLSSRGIGAFSPASRIPNCKTFTPKTLALPRPEIFGLNLLWLSTKHLNLLPIASKRFRQASA